MRRGPRRHLSQRQRRRRSADRETSSEPPCRAYLPRSILDSSDYEGADHGIADADTRVRFRTNPFAPDCRRLSSQRNWKQRASGCGNVDGANVDKMLEVDPESCAQAFKGSSRVSHAPPMTEGKASTQGPGALAGLKVIDLTRVLGGPYCTMVLSDHDQARAAARGRDPRMGSTLRRR